MALLSHLSLWIMGTIPIRTMLIPTMPIRMTMQATQEIQTTPASRSSALWKLLPMTRSLSNEVTCQLVGFTEFEDLVSVGDQVKVQVIFNTDGTFTILHIEIFAGDNNGKTIYSSADADATPSVLWTSPPNAQ